MRSFLQNDSDDSNRISDFSGASTAEARSLLKKAVSFGDFLRQNRKNMLEPDLSEYLMTLLLQKNLKRAQVVEGSGIDKAYVYQI